MMMMMVVMMMMNTMIVITVMIIKILTINITYDGNNDNGVIMDWDHYKHRFFSRQT